MQNFKDIETLTQEVMKKRNGEDEKEFKIGIIVAGEEGELPFMLAKRVQKGVLALAQDCEIVSIPALNERTREFSGGNEVLSAYKKIVENFLEMTNFEKHFDGVVFIPSGFNCTVGCLVSSIRLNLPTLVLPIGLSHKVEGENLLEVLSMAGQSGKQTKQCV
jgi:dihydroxyacid dehydratase/phosphogluconate dehydratase